VSGSILINQPEAGDVGRTFAFGQIPEVQVAHLRGGVHDGAGDACFLGGRIPLS
jgi:hypothetical protein